MKFAHRFVLALACLLPLVASAQWQWVDKQGKKVFSDQPPPLDIPEKNIVKRPGAPAKRLSFAPATPAAGAEPAQDDAGTPAAAPAPNAEGAPTKPSGVDKDLEEKTRKAEEAEKAKRAAEEKKIAAAKAENCSRARQSKATLDSGIRVARVNDKGEREVLDDQARTAETQRTQQLIDSNCK